MRNALAQHLRPYLHSPADEAHSNPMASGTKWALGIATAAIATALTIKVVRAARKREWVLSAEQDNYGDWYWIARSGVEQIDSEDVPTDQHAWPTKEIALVAGYDYITKIKKEKVL
jgi:tRNA(His) 5'-end guanylyltransferase